MIDLSREELFSLGPNSEEELKAEMRRLAKAFNLDQEYDKLPDAILSLRELANSPEDFVMLLYNVAYLKGILSVLTSLDIKPDIAISHFMSEGYSRAVFVLSSILMFPPEEEEKCST